MKLKKLLDLIARFLGLSRDDEVFYLSAGEALPTPLSPEEEKLAVAELGTGSKAAKASWCISRENSITRALRWTILFRLGQSG